MKSSTKTLVLTGYKTRQSAVTAGIRKGSANVQVDGDLSGFYRITPRENPPVIGKPKRRKKGAPVFPPATWVYVKPKNWKAIEVIHYREAAKSAA